MSDTKGATDRIPRGRTTTASSSVVGVSLGQCEVPACGQAVGCGLCDTPELWRGATGLCARVAVGACAGAAESLPYIYTSRKPRERTRATDTGMCVECLSADKPWGVVCATRRSYGVAGLCAGVGACAGYPLAFTNEILTANIVLQCNICNKR